MPLGAAFVVALFVLPTLLGCEVENNVFFVVLSGFGFCILSETTYEMMLSIVLAPFFGFVRCLRYMLARRVCRATHSQGDRGRFPEGDPSLPW